MQFESMDGMYTSLSPTAALIYDAFVWSAVVGPTLNDFLTLINREWLSLCDYTWDKRRQFRLKLNSRCGNDPTGEYCLFCGDPGGPWMGFGLVFTPTEIIARLGNGSAHTDLVLFTGLYPGDEYVHLYDFLWYPTNGLYITVDGVFVGAITTDLPSGTNSANIFLYISLFNTTAGESAELRFSRIIFSQDK
jgi:hypothetical protein